MLEAQALILYGYQITEFNSSLDFRNDSGGDPILATLRLGFYSLASLMREISRAMQEADPDNIYTVTADRTAVGGLENRITISTNGTFLELLFSSGPRAASSVNLLIGFNGTDYTGDTEYTGPSTSGTVLQPTWPLYSYLDPDMHRKAFGSTNIAATGAKEAIVFQIQEFMDMNFKFETRERVKTVWRPFVDWAILQRSFEITPDLSDPETVYEVTLEKTGEDGKGMAWKWSEMLPNYPRHYESGMIQLRVVTT